MTPLLEIVAWSLLLAVIVVWLVHHFTPYIAGFIGG